MKIIPLDKVFLSFPNLFHAEWQLLAGGGKDSARIATVVDGYSCWFET
jgi:hypothetical protein